MRLITCALDGREQLGVRRENKVIPVERIAPQSPATLRELLAENGMAKLAAALAVCDDPGVPIEEVEHRPLLPEPGKVVCIGRNYAAHAAEGGAETPTFPEIFFRGASSLVAHNAPIIRPKVSAQLDFEGEIALVIGKACRHATEEDALDCIAGYSLFNDATIRDYQRFSTQWTIGKNFDGTGAFGPELVTTDELPEGIAGLTLTTTLNGEQMQLGQTDNLVFSVRKLICILSACMTLYPGDVVVTGTPAGVGYARKPPLWMKPGDRVEIEVPEIGKLVNIVQDEQE